MGSKENTWLVVLAPLSVMLIVWGIQLFYYEIIGSTVFNPININTWGVVSFGIFGFVIGSLASSVFISAPQQRQNVYSNRTFKFFKYVCMLLSILVIANNLIVPIISGVSVSELRNQALEDWATGGILSRVNAIFVNGLCCFVILIISRLYEANRKISFFWIFLFAVLCVACFARTLLLIGMSIILLRVLLQGNKPIRMIFVSLVSFVMVFLFLAWLMKDKSAGSESLTEVLIHHLQIYFFGGVSGLNYFVVEGSPTYNSILTVPRFLQVLIPVDFEMPPSFFDFIETPSPLNVFTSMFPPYHDFGVFGVLMFFLVYGSVSTIACVRFVKTNKAKWQTLAGFLIYATTMSIFDDQFLRGLPVLLIFMFFAYVFDWMRYRFFDVESLNRNHAVSNKLSL